MCISTTIFIILIYVHIWQGSTITELSVLTSTFKYTLAFMFWFVAADPGAVIKFRHLTTQSGTRVQYHIAMAYLTGHQCSEWLTHWGRVRHICIGNLSIIGSDNGLSSGRRQAIIWTNAGILLIVPLGTNFNETLFEAYIFSFEKMHLKMSPGNLQPFCLG